MIHEKAARIFLQSPPFRTLPNGRHRIPPSDIITVSPLGNEWTYKGTWIALEFTSSTIRVYNPSGSKARLNRLNALCILLETTVPTFTTEDFIIIPRSKP